jgi:hypothetical protein
MAIRTDGAEPALQGRSLRAARNQRSSSEPTILQPFDQFERDCCRAGFRPRLCPNRVNSLHYRAAALLSASSQLAESIRAAKRFRVVPEAVVSRCSK